MNKENLIKKLENLIEENLDDCFEYHKNMIEGDCDENLDREDLKDFLYDINLNEWEDIGFYVGYLRALDDFIEMAKKINK